MTSHPSKTSVKCVAYKVQHKVQYNYEILIMAQHDFLRTVLKITPVNGLWSRETHPESQKQQARLNYTECNGSLWKCWSFSTAMHGGNTRRRKVRHEENMTKWSRQASRYLCRGMRKTWCCHDKLQSTAEEDWGTRAVDWNRKAEHNTAEVLSVHAELSLLLHTRHRNRNVTPPRLPEKPQCNTSTLATGTAM